MPFRVRLSRVFVRDELLGDFIVDLVERVDHGVPVEHREDFDNADSVLLALEAVGVHDHRVRVFFVHREL